MLLAFKNALFLRMQLILQKEKMPLKKKALLAVVPGALFTQLEGVLRVQVATGESDFHQSKMRVAELYLHFHFF